MITIPSVKRIDRTKKNNYLSVKQPKPSGKNIVAAVKSIELAVIATLETVIHIHLSVKHIEPSVKDL